MDKSQKATMDGLVSSLLESYEKHAIISNIDSENLLNREMIIKICGMVRNVLFPGYFEYKKLKSETVGYHVGELLENINYELTKQTEKALDFAENGKGKNKTLYA